MNLSHPVAERLLCIMDQKHHWAYPHLTRPGLTRAQHIEHFRHEYLVYVRDFPVLIARALGQVPDIVEVRRALADNIYEEQTGGLSRTAPHPELFLRMMEGMGYARTDFREDDAWMHPRAREYRDFLRDMSARAPWQCGVALMTIFVEGSANERAELAGTYTRAQGEDAVRRHPLVAHYGCPSTAMDLVRAHAEVEGGHRADAWNMVLSHLSDTGIEKQVVDVCERALAMWHRYRDGVGERMQLRPNAEAA